MAACGSPAIVSVEQWSDVFTDLYVRIARRFARTEVRERLRRYLFGLLDLPFRAPVFPPRADAS